MFKTSSVEESGLVRSTLKFTVYGFAEYLETNFGADVLAKIVSASNITFPDPETEFATPYPFASIKKMFVVVRPENPVSVYPTLL